ncbi:hypothetical protein [Sphingomonas sp. SUN039]|uniref:hypothetical protein n=1 Tax=Sphingomonas sp. SUN039 TaxID=2937787 RepID=UPI0021644C39|nr:hypothetical protein [Sphingomonas sp. SUN039]UVO53732.1 hypothetical protein M0209_06205 [Sphingomonas sp. SUN039]
MTYDIDFRFRLALNPEGLTTMRTTLSAIGDAIEDARNAGNDPESDPAVRLLARHLGRIASVRAGDDRCADDTKLRHDCLTRIDALAGQPSIVVLARRSIAPDAAARRIFCREAEAQLGALAAAFGERAAAELRRGPDSLGRTDIVLVTPTLSVRVTTDLPRPGAEVAYRRNDGANDGANARSRTADIAVLLDPVQFARRIRRELHIADDRQPSPVCPTKGPDHGLADDDPRTYGQHDNPESLSRCRVHP